MNQSITKRMPGPVVVEPAAAAKLRVRRTYGGNLGILDDSDLWCLDCLIDTGHVAVLEVDERIKLVPDEAVESFVNAIFGVSDLELIQS